MYHHPYGSEIDHKIRLFRVYFSNSTMAFLENATKKSIFDDKTSIYRTMITKIRNLNLKSIYSPEFDLRKSNRYVKIVRI